MQRLQLSQALFSRLPNGGREDGYSQTIFPCKVSSIMTGNSIFSSDTNSNLESLSKYRLLEQFMNLADYNRRDFSRYENKITYLRKINIRISVWSIVISHKKKEN